MFVMRFVLRKTKSYHFLKRDFNDVLFEDIPNVTTSEIKKKLLQHNVIFEEGYSCFIATCPMCHKSTKSATTANRVFINKTTGMFLCPSCKSSGQWNNFQTFLAAKKKKKTFSTFESNIFNEKDSIKDYLEQIAAKTIQVKSMESESIVNILKNFDLPVISSKILDVLDVRIDDEYKKLYFPLENAESNLVGYQVFNRKTKMQMIEPSETCGGVLVGKLTKSSRDTAIIVPGIADFIVLLNSKISGNVICLPSGLLSLSQYILPMFEQYNKLILWFGNDLKSWDVARNFAKKLGEKRCLFVRPMDKQLLPHLGHEQDFKAIISSAQPIWHKSITMFSSLREDVLSDLQNIDKVQGVKWKRFPTLNKILKGHRKGELTVLTGPTGCGKTTFIGEYSLDLAMQGVNTLWGSFEIRNARLARTMLQQMAGLLLDQHLDKFDYWADQFEQLPIYFMTFHGQQAIKVVMEAVEHATYVHDISHVIIDNVQFMMGMSEDLKHADRFWKQDMVVAAFRNFATRKNCHVTLVIHPRKERDDEDLTTSSIFGGAKASQEADNVLIIQDKRLTSVRGKKYLQVAKNRYSGDLGIMALDFDKSSLSYAQKKKTVSEEQNAENQ